MQKAITLKLLNRLLAAGIVESRRGVSARQTPQPPLGKFSHWYPSRWQRFKRGGSPMDWKTS